MIDFDKVPSACFVLEESRLRANLEKIKYVADASGATIILALKGFSMFSSFPLVRQYLKGTTASSLHEARLGFEEYGEEVHAYSPAWLPEEFDELVGYINHITFNSLTQYQHFQPKIENARKPISCGLRINPEYAEVDTDLYNPAIPGSRLGLTASQIGDTLPEGIEGLHFHLLCENDSYTLERVLNQVEEKFGHLLKQAKWLNMGGGHLMTRKGYDLEHVIGLVKAIRERYDVEVIMEPGSAIAWETGYLTSTVLDILPERGGIRPVILDVSIAAHMPDCIEMPYTPKVLGASITSEAKPRYRLGGLTCLAGDYVGDYVFEDDLEIGDRLVFNDMMHYTMVKTTFFNGVKHPGIGIWRENGTFELIKTFSYEEFRAKLS